MPDLKRYALRTAKDRCRCFVTEQKGVAIIEAAITLPLILLIGLGGLELTHFVLTHSRLSQAALGVADNASRMGGGTGDVREVDINEVFTGAQLQTEGMNIAQKSRIILSSLETNAAGKQWIHWQRCFGDLAAMSSYGSQGDILGTRGIGPPGQTLTSAAGTGIMFVELIYEYTPLVMPSVVGSHNIRYTAAFNIREARNLNAGLNNRGVVLTEGVTPLLC